MQSRHLAAALSLAGACLVISPVSRPAQSQPASGGLIDGITVGIGLSMYQGDLDRNPGNKPAQFLASGSLHLMAGVDRSLAGGRLGLEVQYNRLVAENVVVSGRHHVVGLDVTYGRRIGSIPVILYAGVGPAVVLSSYDSQAVYAEVLGLANGGTGFDLTLPLGVVIQDRVRLSTRLALRDRIDGTDVLGGRDLLSNITVAYRFERSR